MQIGNLTAFLQYLLQILFAVLTAVFMFILIPRGAVSAGRINEVLDTQPTIHDPEAPSRAQGTPERGVRRVPGRRVPLPGRRGARPARHRVPGGPGRDHGDRRQHRQRQVDPDQPDPALLRRDRRARSWSMASTSASSDREDLWQRIGDRSRRRRSCSRHRREQPAVRRRRRDRRGAVAGAHDRPGE